jgi:hypothetical protein
VARELDLSLEIVMNEEILLKLAENLPETKSEVVKCWTTNHGLLDSLSCGVDNLKYLEQIEAIILGARNAPEFEVS